MVKTSSVLPLRKEAENKEYIGACLNENIPIICVNRENKKNKVIPFKVLHQNNQQFWLQNEVWEFFLSSENHAKIQEILSQAAWEPADNEPNVSNASAPKTTPKTTIEDTDSGLGENYTAIAAMTEAERIQHIKNDKRKLDNLITQKPREEKIVTAALVETTSAAIMYNHASIMNVLKLTNDDAKKNTQEMVNSTRDLVRSSTALISEKIFNEGLMNTLVAKSNGTILQHMTRVYLNGLAFLAFYNKLVSSSGTINKLRIDFKKKYKYFYQHLLPHMDVDDLTLETVFMGGMRVMPENDLHNWAVGFLVHDIGKAAAVEYHEGDGAYDRSIVI